MRKILLGAVVVALAACGTGGDSEYAEATPADMEGLALEISGASSEGAALSSDSTKQGLDEAPELLAHSRERIKALNDAVRAVVEPIAELVAADAGAAPVGSVKSYGPKVKNGISYRLTVKKVSSKRFGWKLEAKAEAAADDTFKVFAAGALTKGQQPHRGTGSMGIDLDVLKGIDTSRTAQGQLLAGFAHVGAAKSLSYAVKDFTPNAANHAPVTARFVGHRLMPSKATSVRFAGRINLKDSATAAQELVVARTRFIPGTGGRADFIATQGDVPAGKAFFGSACWDAQEKEGFAILRLCEKASAGQGPSCQVIATRGQLSNCRLLESLPPEDPNAAGTEPEAPASDVGEPTVMPSGAGE